LKLDLPSAARLRLTVFGLDGRTVSDRRLDLPTGRYRLPGGERLAPGLYVLRIWAAQSAAGNGIPVLTALKMAIP
jgi:hypothetical protein